MIEYLLLSDPDLSVVQTQINTNVANGWTLVGPVQVGVPQVGITPVLAYVATMQRDQDAPAADAVYQYQQINLLRVGAEKPDDTLLPNSAYRFVTSDEMRDLDADGWKVVTDIGENPHGTYLLLCKAE